MVRRVSMLVLICAVSAQTAGSAQDTAKPSKGTQVGQFVADALKAALPQADALIQLFKPRGNAKEQQATADAARKKLMADATAKIKPLDSLAGELAAIERFLSESVPAATRVARLLGHLDQPKPDLALISSQWNECQLRLKSVGSLPDATLEDVRDGALRIQLIEVRNLNRDAVPEISATINGKDWSDAKGQLRAVLSSLNGVVAIASVEIARLRTDVTGLVQWANSPAGEAPNAMSGVEAMLLKEAAAAIADARLVLKK